MRVCVRVRVDARVHVVVGCGARVRKACVKEQAYLICRAASVCELLLSKSDPLGVLEIRASELKENASLV